MVLLHGTVFLLKIFKPGSYNIKAGWQDKQIKTPNVKKIYFAPPLGLFAYIY